MASSCKPVHRAIVMFQYDFAVGCWTNMKFWLNLCCRWKKLEISKHWEQTAGRAPGRAPLQGKRKALKKRFGANKLCSALQSYCGNICIRRRDPCSRLKPWVIYPLKFIEMRGEKQRKIVPGASLVPIRVILLYEKYPQTSEASYTTRAFYTESLGPFPCIFTCLWQNLESCHSPAADFKGTDLAEAHQLQCPSRCLPAACMLSFLHKHTDLTGLTLLLWPQGGLFSCNKLSPEHPACRKLCTPSCSQPSQRTSTPCSVYPGKAYGSKEQSGDWD